MVSYWARYNSKLSLSAETMNLQLRIVGLSNSRKMLIEEEGIDLGNWKEKLDAGTPASLQGFIDEIITQKSA